MPERNIETSLFVRFAPKADKHADITLSPLRANCRHRPTHGGCTNVCASAASAQRTSLCRSPHKLKLARLPGFGEEWLKRAVEPQDREPTPAGRGLNPVAALHTVGLRRAEVDRR